MLQVIILIHDPWIDQLPSLIVTIFFLFFFVFLWFHKYIFKVTDRITTIGANSGRFESK